MLAACTSPGPTPATPTTMPTSGSTNIRVTSFLGVPSELGADENRVDARVVFEGRGVVDARLRVERDGDLVSEYTERLRIDGRTEHAFDGLELPTSGRYTLTLEVTAPGVRQTQTVTVTKR